MPRGKVVRAPAKKYSTKKYPASRVPRAPARAPARAYAPRALVPAPAKKSSGFLEGLGQKAGGFLGNLASKWLGMGDYEISRNTMLKPSNVPVMHSFDNSIRLTHKEYLQDITATTAFSNQSFSINAGLSGTFPFLSSLAQNYEKYIIHGLCFTFISNSANALNSTNTALGSIIMACDYNALDSSFETKQDALATTFSVSGKPSDNLTLAVECDPKIIGEVKKFIRSGSISGVSNASLNNYDWGNFQIMSQGQQATSIVGELHVSYDIELIFPQSSVPRGLNLKIGKFHLNSVSNSNRLGTSQTTSLNTLGVILSDNTITIPANSYGIYMLEYLIRGDSTASLAFSLDGDTNLTSANLLEDGTISAQSNAGNTSTIFWYSKFFKLTDPTISAVWTISSATLPANAVYGDLIITQLNGNLTD